ncbi:hypothetical protein PG996_010120 [Apiospora saccharicola]|uniref:Uncharacterized protein n=1 Tax=Apiospora saccharicola TaxID=335842 RepID=A0ABR1UMN8_9PEZI
MNKTYPFANGNPDVALFPAMAAELVARIFAYVHGRKDGEFDELLRQDQLDRILSTPFLLYIKQQGPDSGSYCRRILESIPQKTQQVLGKRNLHPIHLLDLPLMPMDSSVWLNYLDVVASMPEKPWTRVPSAINRRKSDREQNGEMGVYQLQTYSDGHGPSDAQSLALYNAYSADKFGGAKRNLTYNRVEY